MEETEILDKARMLATELDTLLARRYGRADTWVTEAEAALEEVRIHKPIGTDSSAERAEVASARAALVRASEPIGLMDEILTIIQRQSHNLREIEETA